jgi:hypothetical protein
MNSKWSDEGRFVKTHLGELEQLLVAVKDRRLQPRDMAVVMGMLSHASWQSGKIAVNAARLAEELGMVDKHVISSISRLRKELVITKLLDEKTGLPYYLLNPKMFSVGTLQQKGYLWKLFVESL